MRKIWDVVVVGGANMDYLVRGEKLPAPGETLDGHEFLQACGGKGANQAVAAARLGARVAFVGCVGKDDNGNQILETLSSEGINVDGVVRRPKEQTGAAVIMVDANGEKQILVAPGANHNFGLKDVNRAREFIQATRVFLTQFEIPVKSVLRAAQIARRGGAKIVLDPAPAAKPPTQLLKLVSFIRPNSSEAEALTGVRVWDPKSARKAAQILLAKGIEAVAVQAGDKGDLVVWKDGERLFPRVKVKTVDATGAGDAFAGAIAVALAESRSYEQAGAFANVAAALATTKFGAQTALPRRAEVMRLLSSK